MSHYDVYYPSQVDVQSWKSAYIQKTKPDAWPYGLNRLEHAEATVASKSIVRQRAFGAAAAALLGGQVRPKADANSGKTSLAITWDERTALDLYLSGRTQNFATGVIWATDQLRQPLSFARTQLLRRVLRHSTAVWCLSFAQLQVLDRWMGKHSKGGPAQYLPFGIDTEFYSYKPVATEDLIVSVGGDRDRDPRTLFAALAAVIRVKPGTRAVVQTTSTLTPPSGVKVVRHLTHAELRDLYAEATLIAVATKPNIHVSGMTVSLEAAATGRPVVITRTPGMSDYIRDVQTGLLTPVGEPQAMAAAILRLLDDPARRQEMGRAARIHALENHSSSVMASRLREILEGSVSHR